MRKYISIVFVAFFALSFSSCNKGPKIITERYLVRYIPAGIDTAHYENGVVTDIETIHYNDDKVAISNEYKRYETETKALIKKCKELRKAYSEKSDKALKDSLTDYGKWLYECRCLVFFSHDNTVNSDELLDVIQENGADIISDIKYAKENHLRAQFLELHNDIWLRELNDM